MAHYDLHESIGYLTNLTSRALGKRLVEHFEQEGFNFDAYDWFILSHLAVHEGVNQQTLGRICGRDRASITRIIDQLEDRGIVQRHPNPEDRRNKQVYLTPEGHTLKNQLSGLAEATLDEAYAGLSPDEMTIVITALQRMLSNLCEPRETLEAVSRLTGDQAASASEDGQSAPAPEA